MNTKKSVSPLLFCFFILQNVSLSANNAWISTLALSARSTAGFYFNTYKAKGGNFSKLPSNDKALLVTGAIDAADGGVDALTTAAGVDFKKGGYWHFVVAGARAFQLRDMVNRKLISPGSFQAMPESYEQAINIINASRLAGSLVADIKNMLW